MLMSKTIDDIDNTCYPVAMQNKTVLTNNSIIALNVLGGESTG